MIKKNEDFILSQMRSYKYNLSCQLESYERRINELIEEREDRKKDLENLIEQYPTI
jgi:hypothetical protein